MEEKCLGVKIGAKQYICKSGKIRCIAQHYSWLVSPSQDPQPILEVHVGHFKALQISKLYKYKAMAEQSVEMMIRGVDSVGRV